MSRDRNGRFLKRQGNGVILFGLLAILFGLVLSMGCGVQQGETTPLCEFLLSVGLMGGGVALVVWQYRK